MTTATDDVAALDPNQLQLMIATFDQLIASQDWAGILELESKMSDLANSTGDKYPRRAGIINLNLGAAHQEMGREGALRKQPCTTKQLSKWQRTRVTIIYQVKACLVSRNAM